MKILLVHCDSFPWATTRRAKALKKCWPNDKVTIRHFNNLPDGKNFDVIHFLYSGAIGWSKDYILANKDKVFTTLASERTLSGYYNKIGTLVEIYRNTLCCVAHNPTLTKKLKQLIKQKNVVYIPNDVDVTQFKREYVVGFVGAEMDASDHKGFKLIKQACDELGLTLKTSGTTKGSKLLPLSQMPAFYRSIDCLVLASVSEGCNNPTLEALAMNKPVISTKVGIARELEGVILVDRNVESIKNALRKVSGRLQILENYTWDKVAKRYRDLYTQFLPKN